jgi:hypothetical protein
LINVRVSPHIDLCFLTSASSTPTVRVPGLGKASRMKGMSGIDVAPSGPFTETAVWDGVSVTVGGMVMGSLPICDVWAWARAVELKERKAVPSRDLAIMVVDDFADDAVEAEKYLNGDQS